MQELRNYIKTVELMPVEQIDEATNGSSVDTFYNDTQGHHFDSILIRVGAGDFGLDIGSVKFKVEESNVSNFASGVTVASGGEEVSVGEEEGHDFQIERTKRYIRVVATPVDIASPSEDPGEDVATIHATGILANWAIPMPLL